METQRHERRTQYKTRHGAKTWAGDAQNLHGDGDAEDDKKSAVDGFEYGVTF
jgi:hypothetical protein